MTTGISAADRARTVQAAVAPDAKAGRHRATGAHLSRHGAAGRRPGTRGTYGSRMRPRADGRIDTGGGDLRNHEGRRHDGAHAGPAGVRCDPRPGDRRDHRPHSLPQPDRAHRRAHRRASAEHRLWRVSPGRLSRQAHGRDAPGTRPRSDLTRHRDAGARARAAVGDGPARRRKRFAFVDHQGSIRCDRRRGPRRRRAVCTGRNRRRNCANVPSPTARRRPPGWTCAITASEHRSCAT